MRKIMIIYKSSFNFKAQLFQLRGRLDILYSRLTITFMKGKTWAFYKHRSVKELPYFFSASPDSWTLPMHLHSFLFIINLLLLLQGFRMWSNKEQHLQFKFPKLSHEVYFIWFVLALNFSGLALAHRIHQGFSSDPAQAMLSRCRQQRDKIAASHLAMEKYKPREHGDCLGCAVWQRDWMMVELDRP